MKKPSCHAAALILQDRETGGDLLREMEALDDPTYGELLAKHILQNAHAWRESELWSKHAA